MSLSSLQNSDNENENNSSTVSNNFWELRQYYRTVKRVDNGNKLCTELCNLIHERAELEKSYANQLKRWSSKWESFINTNIEYGTTQSAWMAFCRESDSLANVHQEIRKKLAEEVETDIRNWQKEHYHKSPLPPQSLKETKQIESEFDTAQRPWAKRYKKVAQYRKDFHNASRTLTSCQTNLSEQPPGGDQEKKWRDRLTKAAKDKEKFCNAYCVALKEMDQDKDRYIDEMNKVFTKSQRGEEERLTFFKSIFTSIASILNPITNPQLATIYATLQGELGKMNVEQDLAWWADNHGSGMEFYLPKFEEYNETAVQRRPTGSINRANNSTSSASFVSNRDSVTVPIAFASQSSTISANEDISPTDPNAVTFGVSMTEDSVSDGGGGTTDLSAGGRSVRALYDYEGAEEDELGFLEGDVFVKLGDEDQGWSRGIKDGKIGLFPSSYVEEV